MSEPSLADVVHEAVERAKADDDALAEAERRGAVKAYREMADGIEQLRIVMPGVLARGLRSRADAIENGAPW